MSTEQTTQEAPTVETTVEENSNTTPTTDQVEGGSDLTTTEPDAVEVESAESVDEAEGTTDESASVPESYEKFEMPEGIELDETVFEQASETFKELGLTQEQGQKLADLMADKVANDARAQQDQFDTCLLYTSPSPRDRG